MTSIQGKLSTLTAVTEIGHGFFQCRDEQSAAMYICKQSSKIIPFKRSIITCKNKILAVTGQDQISQSSSLKNDIKKLIRASSQMNKPSLHKGILEDSTILCISLICPRTGVTWKWFIELDEPERFQAAAELLGKHFSLGLLHIYKSHNHCRLIKAIFNVPMFLFICFVLSCIFVELPEKTIAPLIVKSLNSATARTPVGGLINYCLPEGSGVNEGTIIATVDVGDFQQELEETLKSRQELQLRIKNAVKASLTDSSKLIDIKLLQLEESKLKSKIQFLEYKVSNKSIKAPVKGTVRYLPEISLNGGSNVGRSVIEGEALCFIDDDSARVAEITLAESEIRILNKLSSLKIYYHNSPQTPVSSEIIKIPKLPEVSPLTRRYVYKILAYTSENTGATGTAHFRGKKVRLGFYLFKKIYFYIRDF